MSEREALMRVRNLTVVYAGSQTTVACTDVSLDVYPGEILGIAGESGSGKSTLLNAMTRLSRPPAITVGGEVYFNSSSGQVDLLSMPEKSLRKLRWKELSIVMQSAMDALNPSLRLRTQFAHAIATHYPRESRDEVRRRTIALLDLVRIPGNAIDSFPHQLSGGMRQRAMLALALTCEPRLIVMDEPTTAVDVVMQRLIMSQITDLRERLGVAVVLVTHDLPLLLDVADRVAIMYAGRVVETGSASDLLRDPRHPYTLGLRDSFPRLKKRSTVRAIPGTPADLRRLPEGCAFAPRCGFAVDSCRHGAPPRLVDIADGRSVACPVRAQGVDANVFV